MSLSPEASMAGYLVASAVAKACLLTYVTSRWRRHHVATIRTLRFYPVKSCRGFDVDQLLCERGGTVYDGVRDRSFMVVDSEGRMVTGRTRPRMLLIEPRVSKGRLTLDAPGMTTCHLALPDTGTVPTAKKVSIHGTRDVVGVDCGDEVAAWMSAFLNTPGLRLIWQNQLEHDLHYQDESELSVITLQSVEDINKHLSQPLTELNFRCSIVTNASTNEPYDEDKWTNLFIGDVWLQRLFHTERCLMTTINPETGVKSADQEPLTTLRTYRILPGYKKPCVAVALGVKQKGLVEVGQQVFATREN